MSLSLGGDIGMISPLKFSFHNGHEIPIEASDIEGEWIEFFCGRIQVLEDSINGMEALSQRHCNVQGDVPEDINAGSTQRDATANLWREGYCMRLYTRYDGSPVTVLYKNGKPYSF